MKFLSAISLLALCIVNTSHAANASSANIKVITTIASQCIVETFNDDEAGITFEGIGVPSKRSELVVFSNSPKPIFYDLSYTGTNLKTVDGSKLVLGKDVFLTKDGKTPLLPTQNKISGKRDKKGNWTETVHISTRKGITKDMLLPFDKPELTTLIRIRCPK